MPSDAVILVALVIVVGAVAWTRARSAAEDDQDLADDGGAGTTTIEDDATKGPVA
jgi:hypothetical protein